MPTRAALILSFVVITSSEWTSAEQVVLSFKDYTSFREEHGTWTLAGKAVMNPANEKLITAEAGVGMIVNGPDGKTVNLFTREEFGDVIAHIEFMAPKGSNSGVYFQGRYEIQVLDSWGVEKPGYGDCGGIYQRWDDKHEPNGYEGHAPLLNASLAPGEWQAFDVVFRAPRFDGAGKKTADAKFLRVLHNNKLVHENVSVTGPTRAAAYADEKPTGPLMFQGDHGPVAYRNTWVVRVKDAQEIYDRQKQGKNRQ